MRLLRHRFCWIRNVWKPLDGKFRFFALESRTKNICRFPYSLIATMIKHFLRHKNLSKNKTTKDRHPESRDDWMSRFLFSHIWSNSTSLMSTKTCSTATPRSPKWDTFICFKSWAAYGIYFIIVFTYVNVAVNFSRLPTNEKDTFVLVLQHGSYVLRIRCLYSCLFLLQNQALFNGSNCF